MKYSYNDKMYSTSIIWFKLVQVLSNSVNFNQSLSVYKLVKY